MIDRPIRVARDGRISPRRDGAHRETTHIFARTQFQLSRYINGAWGRKSVVIGPRGHDALKLADGAAGR